MSPTVPLIVTRHTGTAIESLFIDVHGESLGNRYYRYSSDVSLDTARRYIARDLLKLRTEAAALPDTQREVITLYYGLDDEQPMHDWKKLFRYCTFAATRASASSSYYHALRTLRHKPKYEGKTFLLGLPYTKKNFPGLSNRTTQYGKR